MGSMHALELIKSKQILQYILLIVVLYIYYIIENVCVYVCYHTRMCTEFKYKKNR